jgi:hypothetical protein
MSADNTAQTILAGAQLTSRANEGLGNAIIGGFNAINNSIKMESDMMQQMIASTIDVRRTEIDEWYKKESLKLQSKQLNIQAVQNKAQIDYNNSRLDAIAAQQKKQVSMAPFVTASKNYSQMLLDENAEIEEKIKLQNITISGGKYTDQKTTRFFPGLRPGSPEFLASQETLKQLQTKREQNKTKASEIFEASQRLSAGADPAVLFKDTFPELETNDNNFIRKNAPKTNEGLPFTEPTLPTDAVSPVKKDPASGFGMLTGSEPQEKYPSPLDQEEQSNSDQWDNLAPIMEEPKEIYQPLGEFRAKALDMAMSVDDKTPYDVRVAATWKSWLSPEDQAILEKEKQTSLRSAYSLIGASIIDRHSEGTPSSNEDIIKEKVARFKDIMMKQGEDPSVIDLTVLKVEQKVLDLIGEEDMIALQEKGNAEFKAALRKKLNESAVTEYSNQKETADPDAPKLTGAGAFTAGVESQSFGGRGNNATGESGPLTPETKLENQKAGLAKSFNKQFAVTDEFGKQVSVPFASNPKYIKWLNSFDDTPNVFGVTVTDQAGWSDGSIYGPLSLARKPKPKEKIEQLVSLAKKEILSDPEKAYNFWLERERKAESKAFRKGKFETQY